MKDPYVYDGTDVLINLGNFTNQDKLDEFESAMFKLAFISINENYHIKSTEDIFNLHKTVFSNVYKWAGQPRKINIYKSEQILNGLSVEYSDYKNIKKEIKKLDSEFKQIKLNKDINITITKIATLISKLWKIHAFREGNTRIVGLFLFFWMKDLGIDLNSNFLGEHAKYFRNALVLSCIGEYSEQKYLINILNDSINTKAIINNNNKYKSINGYNLDNYKYNYHHIKQ